MEPKVTKQRTLDMQVCVPADWTDDQARQFAEEQRPCRTAAGWQIAHPERRVNCAQRDGFVHITLERLKVS